MVSLARIRKQLAVYRYHRNLSLFSSLELLYKQISGRINFSYPEALLNDDLCKISTVSRNEALRPPAERDSTESRVPLVLTYNQFNTGTKRILFDNFQIILSDPATRTIYPELSLVSYRRDRNLRDYLVHSAERTDSDRGTFACRHPRCLTCRHTTSRTILQSPKRLYTIRDRFTCLSVNVVYSIICRRCGCLYIRDLQIRLRVRVRVFQCVPGAHARLREAVTSTRSVVKISSPS